MGQTAGFAAGSWIVRQPPRGTHYCLLSLGDLDPDAL